mgnify:CR=1 FL=1
MEAKRRFISRSKNMRRMVAALLVYSLEHEKEKEEIDKFLITNEFLFIGDIENIRNKLILIFKNNTHFELYPLIATVHLISVLNSFEQPISFKDKLQQKRNKQLIYFCKTIFKNEPFYREFCGFTYNDYTGPISIAYASPRRTTKK